MGIWGRPCNIVSCFSVQRWLQAIFRGTWACLSGWSLSVPRLSTNCISVCLTDKKSLVKAVACQSNSKIVFMWGQKISHDKVMFISYKCIDIVMTRSPDQLDDGQDFTVIFKTSLKLHLQFSSFNYINHVSFMTSRQDHTERLKGWPRLKSAAMRPAWPMSWSNQRGVALKEMNLHNTCIHTVHMS